MKMTLLATLFAISTSAFATEFKLPDDAISTTPISGFVTSTEPLCPPNAMCVTDGTIVNMDFFLQGCLDEMLPLEYAVNKSDNTVYVSAYNVSREASKDVVCAAIAQKTGQLQLNMVFKPFKIVFLGTDREIVVQ